MKLRGCVLFLVFGSILFLRMPLATGQVNHLVNWADDIDELVKRLEIMHPNLYANISREAFLGYAGQLKRDIPSSTDIEMAFGIEELVARIRNTHTLCRPFLFVDFPASLKEQFKYYPVYCYPFADGLYVVAAAEKYKTMVGRKVVKIGRFTAEKAMDELARFAAADNRMTALGNIPRFFLNDGQRLRRIGAGSSPEKITLVLAKDGGGTFESEIEAVLPSQLSGFLMVSMDAESTNPVPLYLRNRSDNYWYESLPERETVYLQINVLNHKESEPFGDFCRRLFDTIDSLRAKKLIIDLRFCPGGDHIELPLLKGIIARPQLDRSDRLFVIIGRITGSAAEHLAAELKRYTNATFFGEPTGSKPNQYGAMQSFVLPNSRLEISCATKYFQDAGPEDYSMASEPDIFVPRTSEDYRDRRDPVMERIMAYDSFQHLRSELFTVLSEAYAEGGTAGMVREYSTLKDKYQQHGFNMENLLYRDLDAWVFNNNKSENDYVAYLKFVHAELPDAIPVIYDLAFWMNKAGNTEEARQLFQKCIELNPEHHHAKMRLGLMELK